MLLLADVFETFRDNCLEALQAGSCALLYLSRPILASSTEEDQGIKLELLTDKDMLLMFEKGIRGGITQAVHRYAKANNKYMGKQYNPEEESSYLQYLDANNLYGWAMSRALPQGGFKWVDNTGMFTAERIAKMVKNADRRTKNLQNSTGYLLEVDVEYPEELHDAHNDLPFLPEKKELGGVTKLVPNLHDKEKYVVHMSDLDQALKHGLILKKVHRVIKFTQSAWLKCYIDFNTRLRANASNKFEKDFFKLMNNSVFGKTMENIRKHKDIKLVTSRKNYLKLVMKPNFEGAIRFSEDLVGVEMGKTHIKMNKPVYLGQAILDISKTVMYEFHYDYMQPKYGEKLRLCYMDTDSFVYHIKTDDFYRDIAADVEARFDTSEYSEKRPLTMGINKKVLGVMKDVPWA